MVARVLVVDDLLPNVKLLQAKLESEYYEVITAHNGKQALDMVEKHMPDIVLLDVMMPEMDGFEACKRLKGDPKTADIPVIMITALNDVQDRVQGLNAGADDFLTKPINDLALFARIRSLVRLKQMTDEIKIRDQAGGEFGREDDIFKEIGDIKDARIVVVDDDISQAKLIAEKLTELEYKVEIIDHPDQGMKIEDAQNCDLIVVSTQLAEVDGLGLCANFRRNELTKNIPLLIMIEENNTELMVKGLDMGINDYLMIPIDANETLARVNIQLKRKRYQDALRKKQQQKLSQAVTDALTGLYNRRYFDTHIGKLLQSAEEAHKKLSLIIIDIDHFKDINDNYGHLSGDEVLKQLPEIMKANVRASDLPVRYGGEEFVIVMPRTLLHDAATVAERIRKAVEEYSFTIPAGEGSLRCTISVGVSASKAGDSVGSMVERADQALYHVKNTGRNRVAVYPPEPLKKKTG